MVYGDSSDFVEEDEGCSGYMDVITYVVAAKKKVEEPQKPVKLINISSYKLPPPSLSLYLIQIY